MDPQSEAAEALSGEAETEEIPEEEGQQGLSRTHRLQGDELRRQLGGEEQATGELPLGWVLALHRSDSNDPLFVCPGSRKVARSTPEAHRVEAGEVPCRQADGLARKAIKQGRLQVDDDGNYHVITTPEPVSYTHLTLPTIYSV